MRVYVLHFDSLGCLMSAFDRVLEDSDVESCMIEPEHLRLRFVGPRRMTEKLVEQIYQQGGLAWCSRHDILDSAASAA